MQKLLEMRRISKSFFGVEVLKSVDFFIEKGEVVALCGENGAGKSTLMKILSAVHKQDTGTVMIQGELTPKNASPRIMQQLGISMIHQELNLIDNMTVAQNIFLSHEPKTKVGIIDFPKMNRQAKALLDGLGEKISPSAKVGSLKIAQKQMVEIAKAISFELKVLIMDEPTAVLTKKETKVLFRLIKRLQERGVGIVYISHRLGEIIEIADKVTVLRDGNFVATKNIADVTEKDIAKLMVGREVSESVADDFTGNTDDIVLEAQGISGDILKNVSFKVARGEILGFSGLIGAGRSELMEMIFGIRKFDKGTFLFNGEPLKVKNSVDAIATGISFATEDRKSTGLVLNRNIAENMDYVRQVKQRGFLLRPKEMYKKSLETCQKLRVKCSGPSQLVKNLSGGNQQKVVLAKWLAVESELFIVDEPTRGIDIGSRAEIYEILRDLAKQGKAVIVVSSDLTEILSICQRIIVMHEGKKTGELTGSDRTEEIVMNYAANL